MDPANLSNKFLIYEIGSLSFVPVIFKKSQVAICQHYFPIANIYSVLFKFTACKLTT